MRIERLSKKNMQKMYYLEQTSTKTAVDVTNAQGALEYIVVDGTSVPLETGYYEIGHEQRDGETTNADKLVMFYGNISMSGGETYLEEYGVNSADYDAVLVVPKNSLPITETSYVWFESSPKYMDGNIVDNGTNEVRTSGNRKIIITTGRVDTATADYRVVKVVLSLGIEKYLLKAVVH